MRKALFLVLFVSFISLVSNSKEAKFNYRESTLPISHKVEDITLKYSQGEGTDFPYIGNYSTLRLRPKNKITLSFSEEFVVEKIEFKYYSAINFCLTLSQTGNYEEVTTKNHIWTGAGSNGITITNALGPTNAAILSITVTYSIKAQVEKPEFSVVSGSYLEAQIVSITSKTSDAKIYYTEDGSLPSAGIEGATEGTTALYQNPLVIDRSIDIKAIAFKDGKSSDVSTASYNIYKPNDEITVTINFPDLATGYLPTGETEFVSLKDITLIDPSHLFTVESLSEPNQTSYPLFYGEGYAHLSAGSQFKISATQANIVIEKVWLKMYESPSGFVYINDKKSTSIYEDKIIEWEGTALETLNILNPIYESNGYGRKIVEIKITYRQAKQAHSIADIINSINIGETGYIATDMSLTVGYHHNNQLYATDGASWMLLNTSNSFGGNTYNNGDIITDKIIGKMQGGNGATLIPLAPFTSTKGSISLSAEPLRISELFKESQVNKFVQLKWATYNGTTNMLIDATGSIIVDPQYGITLTDKESYTLRGFVGTQRQSQATAISSSYIFSPTDILAITTGIETPMPTHQSITINTQPGTLCITAQHPQQVTIYTTAGNHHSTHNITSGTTQITLPKGIYILQTESNIQKAIIR